MCFCIIGTDNAYDDELKYSEGHHLLNASTSKMHFVGNFRKTWVKVQFGIGLVHCCLPSSEVGMPSMGHSTPHTQADIKLGSVMTAKKSFLFYPKQSNSWLKNREKANWAIPSQFSSLKVASWFSSKPNDVNTDESGTNWLSGPHKKVYLTSKNWLENWQ